MFRPIERLYRRFIVRLVLCASLFAPWFIGGAVLFTGGVVYYATKNLGIDTNTDNMLDRNLPFRKLNDDYNTAFPDQVDLLVAVIDGDTVERAEAAGDELAMALRKSRVHFRSVQQPANDPFFAKNGLLYLDDKEFAEVTDRLADAQPYLATLAADTSLRGLFEVLGLAIEHSSADYNRQVLGDLFTALSETTENTVAGHPTNLSWRERLLPSRNGSNDRRQFVIVQPPTDYGSLDPHALGIDMVRATIHKLGLDKRPGIRVRLTGSVAIDHEELSSVRDGAGVATAASFVLVLLLLFAGLRSARLVFPILITLIMGLVWTAGFATLAIGHLNLVSVTFAVLFVGLGVDFGIQFGMRYREELDTSKVHRTALIRAAYGTGASLALAAIAAAISFAGFVPTAYLGLAELGIISSGGMVIALIANFTVLPALLTLIPVRRKLAPVKEGFLVHLRHAVISHRKAIVAGTVVLCAAALTQLPRASFDFDPINLRDPTTESVATYRDLAADPQESPYSIQVLEKDMGAADAMVEKLSALPTVDKVITLSSFIPEKQDEKLASIDDLGLLFQPVVQPVAVAPPKPAEQAEAVRKLHRLLEARLAAVPDDPLALQMRRFAQALSSLDRNPGWPGNANELQDRMIGGLARNIDRIRNLLQAEKVTLKNLPSSIRRNYVAVDGRVRIQVLPKENLTDSKALRRFVDSVRAVAPNASDAPVNLLESGRVVVEAAINAARFALIGVVVLLLIVTRSVRDTLIVLLPLGIAGLLTVAGSVVLGIPFNFANVVALPLLLGLGVAFGIYLVMRERGGTSVQRLFHSSTPRAVFFSVMTTIVSFGALAFSRHLGMAGLGQLLALALSLTLICSLIVVPAVMAMTDRRGQPPSMQ